MGGFNPETTTAAMAEPSEQFEPEKSDSEIIAAILAGDREAFRFLMERYQQMLFGYLFRLLLRDSETARELTQNVFMKAFENLARVDRNRPLAPWLYRIAHNEAANYLRTRARHPETALETDHWSGIPASETDSPEDAQLASEESTAIRQALDQLKPRQREALVLHYFEDRSYEEIAEILDIPPGTVGTLIHRGRKRLESLLGEDRPE